MKRLLVIAILNSINLLHAQSLTARHSVVLDLTAPDLLRPLERLAQKAASQARRSHNPSGLMEPGGTLLIRVPAGIALDSADVVRDVFTTEADLRGLPLS